MEVVVGVSTGVMKPLLSKLTKLLGEEYVKFKGVRKQIKFLRDELSAMSATLEVLADAEQLNPEVRLWRDKLRELAYDLEDCIDAFMARVDQGHDGHTGFIKKFFRKLKRSKARHEIANQIEELKASVMEASERHKRYDFTQLKNNSGMSSVDPRLQVLYEDIENLVGLDGPKKDIIELLTTEMNGSSAKIKVVSIAGCGGLGKTTLAKQVYDTIKGQFSCSAFVSVSRTPDVRKVLIHISDGVGSTGHTQDDDEQQLIDKLRKHLGGKRYIVVIDDVWDAEAWEFIKLALPNNDLGSRIISTTRSVIVAKSSSSHVYEIKPLSIDDSKRLFFKRVFGSETSCYPHLEDVSHRVLRKCGGLPLAIVTISSMLTNQLAKEEWDRVLRAIGSALANKPDAQKMTSIISLSYFDVPHNIRTCLLYLSVFPEDYKIKKQCLINRWIAEGFIHEEEERTKYEIGEGYFNDLINRSMIQPVGVKYGQAKACRVHDIIHDYIKCKAAEDNFVTSSYVTEHSHTSEYKVRRISVSNHSEENVTIWADPILSHVRSVFVFGQLQPVKTSMLPSTALRVLDLQYCRRIEDHHLECIEKLFHLKYLCLYSCSTITKLPDKIGELQYLQTLDVRFTRIEVLPSTITRLQRLAHLYVNRDIRFPDGMIGLKNSLEGLREYGVKSLKSLQEFSKLTKLRTLKLKLNFDSLDSSEGPRQVEGCYNYVGTLLSSCNLYNLHITDDSEKCMYPLSLDSWHPAAPCSLRKLLINCRIYAVPNWMVSLGNLVVLNLCGIICLRQEDVEILGAIPSLLFLQLATTGGTKGRIVVHGSNTFRSLKYFFLGIRYCGTALEFQVGSMPNLEHLKLMFPVHKRGCLNGASSLGIQHLSTLTKVEIKILGDCLSRGNCNPTEDKNDGAVRCVASAIKDAIMTHPNRPILRFETEHEEGCEHFEYFLRGMNEELGGSLTEWLKIWQIEEEQTEQEETDKLNRRMTDEEEHTGAEEGEQENDKEEDDT